MAATFCQQNANYVTPPNFLVRVHHLECMRDGGILDPDDHLFEVFDEENDQILAIYDEQDDASPDPHRNFPSYFAVQGISSPPTSPIAVTSTPLESRKAGVFSSNADGDIVEITSLSEPPTDGLRVVSDATHALQQLPSSSSSLSRSDYGSGGGSAGRYEQKRPITGRVYQPALKGSNDRSPRVKHKVTMSPEVERKFYPVETEEFSLSITANENDSQQRMERSTARKSRITDSFFDAKERLEEALAERNALLQQQKVIPPVAGAHPGQTVIVLSDTFINNPIGIEISPVHDPTNNARLLAVEIRQIDDEGRIAADGRIKVGDRLTEINQRPVYQMSISRARAYLHELQSCAHPTFTVDRPVETFLATGGEISHRSETSSSSVQKKPILSALQQANTTAIGVTSTVEITKHAQGFGFTVTSRDTAKGERLFYIGTVKRDGAAMGVLKAGDRLLEVNDESTTGLRQNDVVDRLKKIKVGETVKLLISRVGPSIDDTKPSTANTGGVKPSSSDVENDAEHQRNMSEEIRKEAKHEEILNLDIALNETGSAGLGVSLKARAVMKPDGTRHDCGIFIKKVLHGGAAFKDGRLRINDQLIGIEDIDLRAMEKNSEASDAITKCLKAIGPSATSVRLRVARAMESSSRASVASTRTLGDVPELSSLSTDKENMQSDAIGTVPRKTVEGSDMINQSTAVVGYGDYTETVKKRTTNGLGTRRRASSTDEYSNTGEETCSLLGEQQRCASEDELSHIDVDAFNRENPTRRSISEKRHMGASNDASHTLAFQKIKHFRQTSAPILSLLLNDNASSLPSAATSTRNHLRRQRNSVVQMRSSSRCALSVAADPNGVLSASLNNPDDKRYNSTQSKSLRLRKSRSSGSITSPRRRSMSLESMGTRKSTAAAAKVVNGSTLSEKAIDDVVTKNNPLSKKPLPSALKRVQRSKASNNSFRQALEQNVSTEELPSTTNTPEYEDVAQSLVVGSYGSLPRRTSATAKVKQQRRKSVGSSLFSRLSQKLGGSRSRDSSPEKAVSDGKEAEKRRLEDERKRIQGQYERLKQKQQRVEFSPLVARTTPSIHPPPPYYGPPQSLSFDSYEQDGGNSNEEEEGVLIEEGELSEDDIISVANSKFYGSMQRRNKKTKRVRSHDKGSTVTPGTPDTRNIPPTHTTVTGATQVSSTATEQQRTTTVNVVQRHVNNSNSTHEEGEVVSATTTTRSMHGSRTAAQAGAYHPPPEVSLVCIPDTSKPHIHKTPQAHQHAESTMRDSGRAQVSYPRQPNDPAPVRPSTTTTVGRSVPVVFPTSRTLFIGSASSSSSAHSRRPCGSRSSSMRARPKSANVRSPPNVIQSCSDPFNIQTPPVSPAENTRRQPYSRSYSITHPPHHQVSQQKHRQPFQQQQSSDMRSVQCIQQPSQTHHTSKHYPPHPQEQYMLDGFEMSSVTQQCAPVGKSNRASTGADGIVTFVGVSPTSPVYLQTLLESPVGSPLPTRVVPIQHYPASRPPAVHRVNGAGLVRRQPDAITHPYDPVQARQGLKEAMEIPDFDYRKLLRPVRRDRVHERAHRITVISGDSAADEALLKAHAARAPPNGGHLHACSAGDMRRFL